MRWEQIHFDRKTWMIPMTKNGESHIVPLVASAINVHIVEPKKTWKKILERAGIDNLRLHDLRRSLGSWQAANGANA